MREPFIKFINKELKTEILLIGCGLPASGKSTCARAVSKVKGYEILSTDIIRLEVLKDEDIFDERVASDSDKRALVYNELFKKADDLAYSVEGMVLDATFYSQILRKRAAGIAASHGMSFTIMEMKCPDDVCLRRISQRDRESYESNAVTEQAFFNNLSKFEAVDIDDIKKEYPELHVNHVIVDTASDNIRDWFVVENLNK